jgi:hypothetical protein
MAEIHVWDRADILVPQEKEAMEARLRDLRFNTGKHISVVIVERMNQASPMAGDDATLVVAVKEGSALLVLGPGLQAAIPAATANRIESLAAKSASAAVRELANLLDRGRPARPNGATFGDFFGLGLLALMVGAIVVVARRRGALVVEVSMPPTPWRLPPGLVTPTTILIAAANLVSLAGVIFFGWRASTLFVLFWLENVVIIALDALRVLFARPADRALWLRKAYLVPAAMFIPGFFAYGHLLAIFGIFGEDFGRVAREQWTIAEMSDAVAHMKLWLALAAITVIHVAQFLWRFIGKGEYRLEPRWDRSFGRLVMLHVVLILGGILATAFGSPRWALVVLVLVKTVGQVLTTEEG